jgi:hypothetical protein
MAQEGVVKVAMNLTTQEQKETWGNVRSHYGKEYSNSAVLYDLVRIKSYQVNGSMSNRDRLDGLDKRVDRIEQSLALILKKLEDMDGGQ